jgi:hypothetical protein
VFRYPFQKIAKKYCKIVKRGIKMEVSIRGREGSSCG